MVYEVGNKFIELVPKVHRDIVLAACWLHDTIEDARLTYNDIKSEFSILVAEIVYALTNEKGRSRKQRANALYYAGIRDTLHAPFVKMCDRIANVQHSFDSNYQMFKMYEKENEDFLYNVRQEGTVMGDYLTGLFNK